MPIEIFAEHHFLILFCQKVCNAGFTAAMGAWNWAKVKEITDLG